MRKVEKEIYNTISDLKAKNITYYDVKGKNPLCDAIIVCTALNERNLNAIKEAVEETAEKNRLQINHVEGRNGSRWIIVDLNDIVVHIFDESERERINIDDLFIKRGM